MKAPKVAESDVLRAVRSLLDLLKAQGKLTYRRITASGIPRGDRNGRTVFGRNEMAGMADLLIFLRTPDRRVLHIELKAPGGNVERKLSEGQRRWRDELRGVGHHDYHVVDDVRELAQILAAHGICHWSYPVAVSGA